MKLELSLSSLLAPVGHLALVGVVGLLGAVAAPAQIAPQWTMRQPVGNSLSSGFGGVAVDDAGISYLTGSAGSYGNLSAVTRAVASDGTPIWTRLDERLAFARDVALVSTDRLYVVGSAMGVLDRGTGEPVGATIPLAGSGSDVVSDGVARVFAGGTTAGDGLDVFVQAFDLEGTELWSRTWDGPGTAPFSLDVLVDLALDPDGNVVALMTGTMANSHTDFVLLEMDPQTGDLLWEGTWGTFGDDGPVELVFDDLGDVYVTGSGVDVQRKFATVKFDGLTGDVLWQAFDSAGLDDLARSIALGPDGNVYVTGTVKVVGMQSADNLDMYTVKRDGTTGQLLWTHLYGERCLWCHDLGSEIRVDETGNVLASGSSTSPPYTGGALLLFVLDGATGIEKDRGVAPDGVGTGAMTFDRVGSLLDAGQSVDPDTGETSITLTKWRPLASTLFVDGFESGDASRWGG